ncbi:MAG: OmpA family protein [Bradyrhizobium sp.]|nr:OmpA family protein [Bradyrhizobium sp.]
MRSRFVNSVRAIGLLTAAAFAVVPTLCARAKTTITREDVINLLSRFDGAPDLDIGALKQNVAERSRSRSRNEPPPQNRPPVAPELNKLPTVSVDIQFDTETPVVRPQSYETIGRIADALVHASLLPYSFLVVGHSDATGKREANALLSQRRADAIRDVLVNTFKIASKRIQSIGLGEEQFIDQAHPASPVNQQIQILTIAKTPEQSEQSGEAAAAGRPSPAKRPAEKR